MEIRKSGYNKNGKWWKERNNKDLYRTLRILLGNDELHFTVISFELIQSD